MEPVQLTRFDPPVTISLQDVRAAGDIQIEYDFERDGYVISQDRTTDVNGYIETLAEKEEVAFIHAWNEESNEDR